MRLVDASLPFQLVYALYHHEYLGYLLSAHIVQVLPNRGLSLIHQGIYSGNMNQFADGLEAEDEKLIKLLEEIRPKTIVKRFGGNPRELSAFFTNKFKGQVKELANAYVQRRLGKIIPLLIGKATFGMANDGYPAHEPIKVLEEQASALFHFHREATSTHYYPTLKLFGDTVMFRKKRFAIICNEPAWMLLDGMLFSFEGALDGKKLRPFLKKERIRIPREKEEEYYRKFVSQLIEKYHVYAKGFEIRSIYPKPAFQLVVKDHGGSFSFERKVQYGRFEVNLCSQAKVKAVLEKTKRSYIFYRIVRDCAAEKRIASLLEDIHPNKNSLTPWEYVSKNQALSWLSNYTLRIQEEGIQIIQDNPEREINLYRPEISMATKAVGDWFDIKAVVKIGQFEIPFAKFRGHILRNTRIYKLPDGTIAILPDDWFTDYRHLMEVAETNKEDVLSIRKYQAPLLHLPSAARDLLQSLQVMKGLERIPEASLPEYLKAKLRPYQTQGYHWLMFMKENGMSGILADDMGLGKTIQTLSLLQKVKEDGNETPTLIIMPTSLIHNWKNEANKFTPQLKVHIHTGAGRSKKVESFVGYDLILSTYGIVRQDIEVLTTFPFHYVILDESQMIKNPESKTAQAINKLKSHHRLSLTGTPVENTVMDIWSQMSFLNPGLLGNASFFKKFYVTPIEKESNEARSFKLKRIINPFLLRRKKQQVEKELPPKIENIHYCEMGEEQQELYDETKSSYRNYLMELIDTNSWKKNKLNILVGLQKLRQIAIHPQLIEPQKYTLEQSGKYAEIKRMLIQVISKQSKVLVFSQFVKMLHILRDDLIREGIKFNYLDGSTRNRQQQVESFQNDSEIPVFLISLKAGGVGLNLTAADYVFILDPWWNPAAENQAIDRSHRIGQKKTVFYYKFITKDSIEEKILGLQRRKAKLSDDIISVEEDMYKSLNAEDLRELLRE